MTASVKGNNCELIAKRWAKALLELVLEDGGISKEEVLSNLRQVVEAINSSSELSEAINNPSVSVEEKQIVLCKLFQNRLMPVVYNFLIALNLKKRVNIIPQIAEEYSKELDNLNNIAHVSRTSAIELDDNRKEDIKNKIAQKISKNVVPDWKVDNSIIGGLVFDIDEVIIDNSVRHKLEDLSKHIIKE